MSLLKVINLNVADNGSKILSNVNFEINSGDVASISGDNGSGKTTLLKAILRDLPNLKVSGSVFYNECNLLNEKDIQWFKRSIAYVPQEDSFACDTPFEEVLYSYQLHSDDTDENYVNSLFNEFGLEKIKNKKLITKNGSQLSGGEKKMVMLLSALCRKNAKLFLIDEPLNNLDAKNVRTINNIISRIHNNYSDAAIVIITHCHALSAITKQFEIKNGVLTEITDEYKCYSCFGKTNSNGYYEV